MPGNLGKILIYELLGQFTLDYEIRADPCPIFLIRIEQVLESFP